MFRTSLALLLVIGTVGVSAEARKLSKKKEEAKKICLSENPSFAGKELKKCIKDKMRRH